MKNILQGKISYNTHERESYRLTFDSDLKIIIIFFCLFVSKLGPTIFKAKDAPQLSVWHDCERREKPIHTLSVVLEYIP